jgi:hypothetical protein
MKKMFAVALVAALFTSCQESLEEKAAKEAQMYTRKNCPAQLDSITTIDSLTFEAETKTLHYWYTITGSNDSAGVINKEIFRNALKQQLSNTTAMSAYKKNGYRFAYTYFSKKHPDIKLFDTVLTKEDYTK